jgi:hypothetical protein
MSEGSPAETQPSNKPGKYVPAPGRDFDVTQISALERYEASKTRNHIARIIVYSTMLATSVAGAYSFYRNDFTALAAGWAVTGPLIGGVVGFYFRHRKDTG